jgi:hypothetical protein
MNQRSGFFSARHLAMEHKALSLLDRTPEKRINEFVLASWLMIPGGDARHHLLMEPVEGLITGTRSVKVAPRLHLFPEQMPDPKWARRYEKLPVFWRHLKR